VLTYEKATGLARWLETSLTAWVLSGGNLNVDPSVTGALNLLAGAGVRVPHTVGGGISARSFEVGSQASPMTPANVPNGRIGFPGYGVRHGQLRWFPAAGTFELVDSSQASPSGDYGATPLYVNLRAERGLFNSNVGVGTISPTAKLEVAGDILASSSGMLFGSRVLAHVRTATATLNNTSLGGDVVPTANATLLCPLNSDYRVDFSFSQLVVPADAAVFLQISIGGPVATGGQLKNLGTFFGGSSGVTVTDRSFSVEGSLFAHAAMPVEIRHVTALAHAPTAALIDLRFRVVLI
jgi:hypothetical protein